MTTFILTSSLLIGVALGLTQKPLIPTLSALAVLLTGVHLLNLWGCLK